MTNESDFALGFWFGIIVARSMGFKTDQVAVREHLRSVQRGDLTLTSEEARRVHTEWLEAHRGGPDTAEYLRVVREAESFDRERVSVILRQPMWQRPEPADRGGRPATGEAGDAADAS